MSGFGFGKVAVTGGAGRLGAYVVPRLARSAGVTVIDRAAPPWGGAWRAADVLDRAGLEQAFAGHDAVVHLAAIPNPFTSSPEDILRVNVQGTWNCFAAAETAGVKRVVLASSDSATGMVFKVQPLPPLYLPIDEDHPLRPTESYGLSKLMAEDVARVFARRGALEVVVLRPTFVVFPTLVPELPARQAAPDSRNMWSYVEPEDVAEAFHLALALTGVRYETFFVSAADTLSLLPTLERIQALFGRLPEIRKPAVYLENPRAAVFDQERARTRLGFVPRSDWRRLLAGSAA